MPLRGQLPTVSSIRAGATWEPIPTLTDVYQELADSGLLGRLLVHDAQNRAAFLAGRTDDRSPHGLVYRLARPSAGLAELDMNVTILVSGEEPVGMDSEVTSVTLTIGDGSESRRRRDDCYEYCFGLPLPELAQAVSTRGPGALKPGEAKSYQIKWVDPESTVVLLLHLADRWLWHEAERSHFG